MILLNGEFRKTFTSEYTRQQDTGTTWTATSIFMLTINFRQKHSNRFEPMKQVKGIVPLCEMFSVQHVKNKPIMEQIIVTLLQVPSCEQYKASSPFALCLVTVPLNNACPLQERVRIFFLGERGLI